MFRGAGRAGPRLCLRKGSEAKRSSRLVEIHRSRPTSINGFVTASARNSISSNSDATACINRCPALVDCGLAALEYEAELSGPSFIDGRSVAMRPYSVVAKLSRSPESRHLSGLADHSSSSLCRHVGTAAFSASGADYNRLICGRTKK